MAWHSALPLSRRAVLRRASAGVVAGAVANVVFIGGRAAAGAKVTQEAAKYVANRSGELHCQTCMQFEPPSSCKVVDGTISPSGWCSFYTHKT